MVPGDTRCLVDMEMVDMDMMVVPGDARWYKVGQNDIWKPSPSGITSAMN